MCQNVNYQIAREQKFNNAANEILNELVLIMKNDFPDDLLSSDFNNETENLRESLILSLKTLTGNIPSLIDECNEYR